MRKMRRLKSEPSINLHPLKPLSSTSKQTIIPYGMENVLSKKKAEKYEESLKIKKVPKAYQHLCLMERKEIYKLIKKGFCLSAIAKQLGRGKQAINHEVRRNGGRDRYDPVKAQKLSMERKAQRELKCSNTIK